LEAFQQLADLAEISEVTRQIGKLLEGFQG